MNQSFRGVKAGLLKGGAVNYRALYAKVPLCHKDILNPRLNCAACLSTKLSKNLNVICRPSYSTFHIPHIEENVALIAHYRDHWLCSKFADILMKKYAAYYKNKCAY